MLGKHARNSFPKEANTRAKKPLELVHAIYVAQSIPRNKYFFSFVDDSSRKTWVYSLKKIMKYLLPFKKSNLLVEKGSGQTTKAMRFDRGSEFTSKEFKRILLRLRNLSTFKWSHILHNKMV